MILVCGGKRMTEIQNHQEGLYPPVIAVLKDDTSNEHLQAILNTVIDPFVVRLLDKDFVKILNMEVGQEAIKKHG